MNKEAEQNLLSGTDHQEPGTQVFTGRLYRHQRIHGHTFTDKPKPPSPKPVRRPARIAIKLALAHKIQEAINRGEFRDQADAAQQLGFTRSRISQIMKLLVLAPDIQEKLLFLERVDGVEPVSERRLQRILRIKDWGEQRLRWD